MSIRGSAFLLTLVALLACGRQQNEPSALQGFEDMNGYACAHFAERMDHLSIAKLAQVIKLDPQVSEDAKTRLLRALTLLPDAYLAFLVKQIDSGFYLHIHRGETFVLDNLKLFGLATGGFNGQRPQRINITEEGTKGVIVHELGHALSDFIFATSANKTTLSDSFSALPVVERIKMNAYYGGGTYQINNQRVRNEWFAETFAMRYCSQRTKDVLRSQYAESYRFAQTYLEKVK